MFGGEEDMTFFQKFKLFCATHWRGLVCVISPIFFMIILRPFPPQKAQWCLYCLLNMAVFWVTECIPLAITSFLPIILFPLTGVMTTRETCKAYMNDSILMFVGSLILAFAVEQSGLHKRLAYGAINLLGYSHLKLLIAMSLVTMFVSMWVTNTAACTMMVPINFAILRVFDSQGICKLYEKNSQGEQVASDITTAYFCAVTYSATIGGIGTLVGTATNIAVKGLFQSTYPEAPELISFPKFSAFGVPYMILMEASTILIMAVQFFGLFRGGSETNKRATITPKAKELAQKAIADDSKKMGSFSFWEAMVLILFIIAMIGFFTRSPQFFKGWADIIIESLGITDKKYIRDSTWALSICFAMFVLPSTPAIFKNCFAGDRKELPKGPVPSVLDWSKLNAAMPYSFMFLLGGGFALSEGAKLSGLNDAIGDQLKKLSDLPNLALLFIISIFVIFITNFASNVAVANVMTPLTMQLAKEIKVSPLWYCLLTGFSASYCFMIPVGTPGNLVVQSAAKISTINMVKAGAGPTLAVIAITWIFFAFYCPIIFDVKEVPKWA